MHGNLEKIHIHNAEFFSNGMLSKIRYQKFHLEIYVTISGHAKYKNVQKYQHSIGSNILPTVLQRKLYNFPKNFTSVPKDLGLKFVSLTSA